MKHALLITSDGYPHILEGRFVILTETAGDTLSVVDCFRDGKRENDGSVICDTLTEALDLIEAHYQDEEPE